MLWLLIGIPVGAGLAAFALPWNVPRRALLLAAVVAQAAVALACGLERPRPVLGGWIGLDDAAALFLAITTLVSLVATVYAVGYLAREGRHDARDPDDAPFVNFPEAVFTGCYLLFLAAMTLVIVSRHWGLMWVAVEATTLASAPLIYFHRYPKSLEATWKYLMVCSVGIALALLGNFFLAVATRTCPGGPLHLAIDDLEAHAAALDPRWLKAAFLLLLVGYGTKMGLAPLHTWLPDAHSEAPSMVSALLSGVLLNCAFLAILRGHSLLTRAGLGGFSSELLVLFGLVSMGLAALFILQQADYKRMLAYSSVEHMGILALGVGVGAGMGSLLHAANHSAAKAMLFLVAGNTLAFFHTKATREARGTLKALPWTGALWVVGLLAITGSPPFGTFFSELAILKGILDSGRLGVAAAYLGALGLTLAGMSAVILPMVYSPRGTGMPAAASSPAMDALVVPSSAAEAPAPQREAWWAIAPPLLLAGAALVLGLYWPERFTQWLEQAAAAVGAMG